MKQNKQNRESETDELRRLAGTHLGKAGDGSLVKPYITPERHDNTLLVPLPRKLNRSKSNIQSSDFVGYEIWHAYEMSFLLETGMPCTGILRTRFGHDTENMIESKSFKLYLNSFDLEKFSSIEAVELIIHNDLSKAAGGDVAVSFHEASRCSYKSPEFFNKSFTNVDSLGIKIDKYTEDESLLELTDTNEQELTFHTANLRSNCEITNQKDTGNCFIYMKGKAIPTLESLTKYVISFRDSQHFHENATEILYQTLFSKFLPDELVVFNIYNRRGGLDIHSFRGSSTEVLTKIVGYYDVTGLLFHRTSQQ